MIFERSAPSNKSERHPIQHLNYYNNLKRKQANIGNYTLYPGKICQLVHYRQKSFGKS